MNSNADFYEAFASTYEAYYGDVDAGAAVRQWLTELDAQKLVPPAHAQSKTLPSLLDIGCGPGWHLRPWQKARFRVTGLDASPAMLRLAATNAAAGPGTDIPLYCADISDRESLLPLTGAFDLAVSHFNFLNLFSPNQVEKVLSGCALLLKVGGLWVTDLSLPAGAGDADNPQPQPEEAFGWRRVTTPSQTNIRIQWQRGALELEENYWFHAPDRLAEPATVAGFSMAPPINWHVANDASPAQALASSSRVLLVFTRTADNCDPATRSQSP